MVPSDSSGSTEGGDPAAADTATSRRSPRLETPPVFPRRPSSPPLQPVAVDFRGPGIVGGGGSEGAGTGGAGSRDALQSLPRRPVFLEQSSSLPESTPICTSPPLLFPRHDSPLSAPARYSP
ncbi:unnamed protein product [Closterium sp. NIES-54]